jgi:hypothetical protein
MCTMQHVSVWKRCLYRKSLVDHIGPAAVAWLEGPHPLRHDTIDDLKAIKALYTEKTKTLKAAQE